MQADPPLRSDEAEPPWLREIAALWLKEGRSFGATAWAFIARPRAFGAAWASGRLPAMNPLGFLVASFSLLLPLDYGLQRLAGWDRRAQVAIFVELARLLRPYLLSIPMALIAHGILRALGSRRRFGTTLGVYLYWITWFGTAWVLGMLLCLAFNANDWLPKCCSLLTMIWAALALAGAHRKAWIVCLVVASVATLASIVGVNALLKWRGWT